MDSLKNLKELFNECLFRVPDYQRGYSWGYQQLDEFWDDIAGMLPRQDHYTGMISLKRVDDEDIYENEDKWLNEKWLVDNGYKVYEVVDGQQRLTTIIILINEIYNYCKKHELAELNGLPVDEMAKTFLVREKNDIIRTYKFGYEVDNPSYNYFKVAILGDSDKAKLEETFYTLNLFRAKEFFAERLSKLSVSEVEAFYRKVTLHLKFNLYNISDDFNVFVAFETMNNRGKRLSYLELLKNRLIYLSTLFNNRDDDKLTVRKKINDTWKEIYGYLGKNKNKPLSDDGFLQDHWLIYFGYSTRKISRNKTIQFHDYILNNYFIQQNIASRSLSLGREEGLAMDEDSFVSDDLALAEEEADEEDSEDIPAASSKALTLSDIDRYIDSLRELIPYWYASYNPSVIENPDISKYIFRLNALGFISFRPLITVLLSRKDISDEDKVRCLKQIERYIFLHFRLNGYFSTWKASAIYNYARDLYFDNISLNEIIKRLNKVDYLSSNNVVTGTGPIDKFEKLSRRDGFYSWSSLRYFLYVYDMSKASTPSEQINPTEYFSQDPRDHYSIEHIFPQKPTDKYWMDRFGIFTAPQKKRLAGSLGNLLPLSTRINSRLQNHSFDEKRIERYRTGSMSELEVAQSAEWTSEEIMNRGLRMLEFMENEFNFKFPNDWYRKKLLGLDFMASEDDENKGVTEALMDDDSISASEGVYTVDYHLKDCDQLVLHMYEVLESKLLALGGVRIDPMKHYIAFKKYTNFCDIEIQKSQIKIILNIKSGEIIDPEGLARDMGASNTGHWGNGDYELVLMGPDDIDYVIGLIKQAYDKQ